MKAVANGQTPEEAAHAAEQRSWRRHRRWLAGLTSARGSAMTARSPAAAGAAAASAAAFAAIWWSGAFKRTNYCSKRSNYCSKRSKYCGNWNYSSK